MTERTVPSSAPQPPPLSEGLKAPVYANVYNVGTRKLISKFNKVTETLFHSGAYHVGIEVYGREWSYGKTDTGTGVYPCEPKKNPLHVYKETVELGWTPLEEVQFFRILKEIKDDWPGASYDLLSRNCCHFSNALASFLGVNPLPEHLTSLAKTTAGLRDKVQKAKSKAKLGGTRHSYDPRAGEEPPHSAATSHSHTNLTRPVSAPSDPQAEARKRNRSISSPNSIGQLGGRGANTYSTASPPAPLPTTLNYALHNSPVSTSHPLLQAPATPSLRAQSTATPLSPVTPTPQLFYTPPPLLPPYNNLYYRTPTVPPPTPGPGDDVLRVWSYLNPKPVNFQLVVPGRKLLREAPIYFYNAEQRVWKERMMFVFDDVALVCMKHLVSAFPPTERLCLRYLITLQPTVNVEETPSSASSSLLSSSGQGQGLGQGKGFCVVTPTKSLYFQARTTEEKNAWVGSLRSAIEVIRERDLQLQQQFMELQPGFISYAYTSGHIALHLSQ